MYMIPFFPSLRPPMSNRLRFDTGSINEEAEVTGFEKKRKEWMESIKNTANDIHPLGKVESVRERETDDDEDANDTDEDTDSHEEEEDDDTNGANQVAAPSDDANASTSAS